MKIAIDHQIFDLQRYGGISRYHCELAVQMAAQQRNDVSIVAPFYLNEYLRSLAPGIRSSGVYIGERIPKVRRLARAINNRLSPWLLARRRPDVLHRTYYEPLGRVKGSATVLTVHDMIHERIPGMEHDRNARGKRAAVAQADHLICISECTRRDLIELYGVDPARTTVVHHGFTLMPVPLHQAPPLPEREFILFVGLREGYKNFEGLLDAYGRSVSMQDRFDIVCFGGGAFTAVESASIQAVTQRRPGAIRQLGGHDGVLQHLYKTAAVFVYPSLYEGFGIPPLEAMSFDCPVVCCPRSSVPEVVGNAAAYFDPDDPESLASAIMQVAEDGSLKRRLIQEGRERLKMFSWERCAQQTEAVYRQVAG